MGTIRISTITAFSINITWDVPTPCAPTQPALKYKVYYRLKDGTFTSLETNHTSFVIKGLTEATSYQIKVSSVNRNGEGLASPVVDVKTIYSCKL